MQKLIADIASKELVSALDANMVAFWSAYGCANGCTLHTSSDLVWFYTGIPVPLFNGVVFAQLNPIEIEATVGHLQAKILAQGAPALWWIGPQSPPAQLGALLEQHGLHRAGEVPGMAIELAGIDNQIEPLPDFTIQKVDTKELAAIWARTAAAGTGFSNAATDALVRLEASLSDLHYQVQPRYVGFSHGLPIATSALALESGVAGIYAVATLPAARGKGIGRAMTVMPLLEARELGYRVGILQASEMGYSLYQKIGFQDVCRYRLFLQSV